MSKTAAQSMYKQYFVRACGVNSGTGSWTNAAGFKTYDEALYEAKVRCTGPNQKFVIYEAVQLVETESPPVTVTKL